MHFIVRVLLFKGGRSTIQRWTAEWKAVGDKLSVRSHQVNEVPLQAEILKGGLVHGAGC